MKTTISRVNTVRSRWCQQSHNYTTIWKVSPLKRRILSKILAVAHHSCVDVAWSPIYTYPTTIFAVHNKKSKDSKDWEAWRQTLSSPLRHGWCYLHSSSQRCLPHCVSREKYFVRYYKIHFLVFLEPWHANNMLFSYSYQYSNWQPCS